MKKKIKGSVIPFAKKNCCLSCGTHFKSHKVEVIFKDVVECKKCGFMWILVDLMEYTRWA